MPPMSLWCNPKWALPCRALRKVSRFARTRKKSLRYEKTDSARYKSAPYPKRVLRAFTTCLVRDSLRAGAAKRYQPWIASYHVFAVDMPDGCVLVRHVFQAAQRAALSKVTPYIRIRPSLTRHDARILRIHYGNAEAGGGCFFPRWVPSPLLECPQAEKNPAGEEREEP